MSAWLTPEAFTVLHTLADFLDERGASGWLVGGTVRDLVMGRTSSDLDVALAGDGFELAQEFADTTDGAFVALDARRGMARVVYESRLTLDMIQLRAPTLDADLALRDFTVNAIAVPLRDAAGGNATALAALHDPCGGLPDIQAGILRPCSPTSLHDDPLRILRAARFAATLHMTLDPDLERTLGDAAHLLWLSAPERVREELLKLLATPDAACWLRHLDTIGVLERLFPELEPARTCDQPIVHFLPVLGHMLETVACLEWLLQGESTTATPVAVQTHPHLTRQLPYAEQLRAHMTARMSGGHPRIALFKLAALLHDIAKPATKQPKEGGGVSFHGHQNEGALVVQTIAQRLRISRQNTAYLAMVVREHMRPGQLMQVDELTRRAVVRFFRDIGDAAPDVLIHALADHLAARGPQLDPAIWQAHLAWTETMLDALWGEAATPTPPPLVNGHTLMAELGIEPGKQVGDLLREIHEAQAAGEIHTRDEALALARHLLARSVTRV